MLAQAPRIDVAELHAFADRLARPDAEDAYRAVEELLSQFLARMARRGVAASSADETRSPARAEAMQRLAARADPARWAGAARARSSAISPAPTQLNLDRKQTILGAFFAIEELAR